MPVISSDMVYYESTGNLGGAITAVVVPDGQINGLFDEVPSGGAAAGEVNYRCIYIRNNNVSIPLQESVVFIDSQTTSAGTVIGIGVGTAVEGGIEQTVANEATPPIGVVFEEGVGFENAETIGTLSANSWKAIWLRRIVTAGALAAADDASSIIVQGDTTA